MSTALRLLDLRADALHALLARRPVLTVEDVYRLPELAGLARESIGAMIEVLVADGRLVDDAYGRLHVVGSRS